MADEEEDIEEVRPKPKRKTTKKRVVREEAAEPETVTAEMRVTGHPLHVTDLIGQLPMWVKIALPAFLGLLGVDSVTDLVVTKPQVAQIEQRTDSIINTQAAELAAQKAELVAQQQVTARLEKALGDVQAVVDSGRIEMKYLACQRDRSANPEVCDMLREEMRAQLRRAER